MKRLMIASVAAASLMFTGCGDEGTDGKTPIPHKIEHHTANIAGNSIHVVYVAVDKSTDKEKARNLAAVLMTHNRSWDIVAVYNDEKVLELIRTKGGGITNPNTLIVQMLRDEHRELKYQWGPTFDK